MKKRRATHKGTGEIRFESVSAEGEKERETLKENILFNQMQSFLSSFVAVFLSTKNPTAQTPEGQED